MSFEELRVAAQGLPAVPLPGAGAEVYGENPEVDGAEAASVRDADAVADGAAAGASDEEKVFLCIHGCGREFHVACLTGPEERDEEPLACGLCQPLDAAARAEHPAWREVAWTLGYDSRGVRGGVKPRVPAQHRRGSRLRAARQLRTRRKNAVPHDAPPQVGQRALKQRGYDCMADGERAQDKKMRVVYSADFQVAASRLVSDFLSGRTQFHHMLTEGDLGDRAWLLSKDLAAGRWRRAVRAVEYYSGESKPLPPNCVFGWPCRFMDRFDELHTAMSTSFNAARTSIISLCMIDGEDERLDVKNEISRAEGDIREGFTQLQRFVADIPAAFGMHDAISRSFCEGCYEDWTDGCGACFDEQKMRPTLDQAAALLGELQRAWAAYMRATNRVLRALPRELWRARDAAAARRSYLWARVALKAAQKARFGAVLKELHDQPGAVVQRIDTADTKRDKSDMDMLCISC